MKPVIVLTLAYTIGLLLGHWLLYFPCSIIVLVILSLLGIAFSAGTRGMSFRRALLFIIPGLAGAAAYVVSAAWLPADHYTRIIAEDKSVHQISGKIVSALDRDPDRTSFALAVQEIDGKRVSGRLRVSVREAVSSTGYGDVLRVSGRLFEPGGFKNPGGFDYPAYLARSGIYRILTVQKPEGIQVIAPGRGIFRTIQNWRERMRQAFLASISGPGSAILQAMVLGEEGALTDAMRDSFLAAGVTHIISISGSHLGMVAIICFGFMSMLMRLLPERRYHWLTIHADPKKIAAGITLPLILFYTLLAGGQTATARSLIMIAAALFALLLDRENSLLHALATAALFILIADPQALFDISFQLSFLSVFSIGFAVLLWKDLQIRSKGLPGKLLQDAVLLMILSIVASLATGPLVAHYFNQISLAGLVSNIVIVPFAGIIVVPLGLISGILSLFLDRLPFAAFLQFTADAFIAIVSFFAKLPFAEFHPQSPGILWLIAYALLIVSLFLLFRAWLLSRFRPLEFSFRLPRVPLFSAAAAIFLLLAVSLPSYLSAQAEELCVPDVGQGDSSLIRLPGGANILIDGGGSHDDRYDTGRRVLGPFLWNRGIRRLDLVVLSHPHPDHMNGLKFILQKFDVGEVWTHGLDTDLPGYDEFAAAIRSKKIRHRTLSGNDPATRIGNAWIQALHPRETFRSRERKGYAAENDRSLVVRVALRHRVLLFTGDIGTGAEKELLRGNEVKCDVLKIAHHGSKSSSSEEFLTAAQPGVAVINAGRGNRYHHPSKEVLERLKRRGIRICRTDLDGALFIVFAHKAMQVTSGDDIELRRIDGAGRTFIEQERENWKRLWLSKREL